MPHVLEPATSGRARCRGCDQAIAKGELRLGERLPNAYGEGEMTLWFHPLCAAYKRPEPLLEVLDGLEAAAAVQELDPGLRDVAEGGLAHRRLPRIDGASRAPTGRARCRCCREKIDKDSWRIGLVYYQEGRFEPSGFIHARCAATYFESADPPGILERLRHFSPEQVDDEAAAELEPLLGAGGT